MFKSLLLIFTLLFSTSLLSSEFDLQDDTEVYLSYYKDVNSSKTLQDIVNLSDDVFIDKHEVALSHFFSTAAFWYKLEIVNSSKVPQERILRLGATWLDSTNFYIYSPNNELQTYIQGKMQKFSKRAIEYEKINIKHTFQSGSSTLYLRVKTRDPLIVHLKIDSLVDFYEKEGTSQAIRGLFLGIILAMIIYNLILYLSVGYKIYGSYVLYLSSFLLMTLSYNGYLYQYLWQDFPNFNSDSIPFFMILYMSTGIFFAQNFLNTQKDYPDLHKISKLAIYYLLGISVVLYMLGGYQYLIVGNILMTLPYGTIMFYMGLKVWLDDNYWASYYLVATSAGTLGTLITALSVMALIPYNEYLYRGVEIGIVMDSLLLSLALAERMRRIQNEKLYVEQERNEEIKKNKQKDEKLLEQSRMAQMGEMISIIAHQWRQPLGAISAASANLSVKLELETFDYSDKEAKEQSNLYILDKLANINGYVKNLTTIIDDFRNFYKPNRPIQEVELSEVVQRALLVLKESLDSDNVNIVKSYNVTSKIKVYDNELMQVILNILKNAKDNFEDKKIVNATITIEVTDREIVICDNGGGIDSSIMSKIFDPYYSTKNEKNGTGLGLYMSKMIIEDHHSGTLLVENRDEGVCFTVSL